MLIRVLRVLIVLLVVQAVHTQTSTASVSKHAKVSGEIVVHENGAVIPDAKVTVEGKNFRSETFSDREGRYLIELPRGIYKVTVEKLAFRTFRRRKVKIHSNDSFKLNIALKYGKPIIVDRSHP